MATPEGINVKKLEAMLAGYEIVLAHLCADRGVELMNTIRREIPQVPVSATQDTLERIMVAADLIMEMRG